MSQPVALVTGGGSGIGLAVTEHLTNFHGYKVAVLDINAERGQAEVDSLNAGSDNCLFLHVDVTTYDQQAQAFKQIYEWGGNRLDLFFANAGIGDTDSIYKNLYGIDEATGLPKTLHLTCLDVNLNAVLQGIHLARHFFELRGKGGKIVITSSCAGVYHLHAAPQYTASKCALVGLVRATAPVF
ncbi:NAD(P)-binding protein, partial [Teratosphaeria nubilosa]